jgi:hypothetical protein
VTAELPPRFASAFARLTSWLEPKPSCAGRFPLDILGVVVYWMVAVRVEVRWKSLCVRSYGVLGVYVVKLW